jgi:biopolymer transport protein ExbD
MAVVKPKRQGPSMDMTAMCDVAFLLLTFFILTTQFKGQESVVIDTPSSISTQKLKEENMFYITLDSAGHPYFGMSNPADRLAAIQSMSSKYGIGFSAAQLKKFSQLPDFGLPLNQLGAFVNLENADREKVKQSGVPNDSTDSQLVAWVKAASTANPKGNLAIKGDVHTKYPQVKALLDAMQKEKINKFKLITDSENKPQ